MKRNGRILTANDDIISSSFVNLLGKTLTRLPVPDEILRRNGKTREVFKEIRRDPTVSAAESTLKALISQLDFRVNRSGSDNKFGDFIEMLFENNRSIIKESYGSILNCLGQGLAVHSIDYTARPGYQEFSDITEMPFIDFAYTPDGRVMYTGSDFEISGQVVPDRKFIVARNSPTFENPYGQALYSECYWPVNIKRQHSKFWLICNERFVIPWIDIAYPINWQNEEDKYRVQEMIDLLMSLSQDGIYAHSNDVSIDIKQNANKASSDIFLEAIKYMDSDIIKVWLGHENALQAVPGKLGNENVAELILQARRDSCALIVQKFYNELIKNLYTINVGFDTALLPQFEMYPTTIDPSLADRDLKLWGTGVRFKSQYMINRHGLQPDTFTIDGEIVEDPNAIVEADPAEKLKEELLRAQIALRGSVGGTQLVAQLQLEYQQGLRDRASVIQILIQQFAYTQDQAELLIPVSITAINRPEIPVGNSHISNRDAIEFAADGTRNSALQSLDDTQTIMDDFLNELTPDQSQSLMQGAYGTLLDIIDNSSSFEEAISAVDGAFPNLDLSEIANFIKRMIFAASVSGAISESDNE